MHVQRDFQALLVQALEKHLWLGKQVSVPGIAGPSLAVSRLVHLVSLERKVPVHVDHKHVERDVARSVSLHQLIQFLVAVSPVAGPPGTEGKTRRQRNSSRHLNEISERFAVGVTVTE